MTFQERAKSELKKKGWIVKELAAHTGISKGTLDTYLGTRASLPVADTAVKIAQALDVTVEYLVTGETSRRVVLPLDIRNIVEKLEILDEGDRKAVESLIDTLTLRYLKSYVRDGSA